MKSNSLTRGYKVAAAGIALGVMSASCQLAAREVAGVGDGDYTMLFGLFAVSMLLLFGCKLGQAGSRLILGLVSTFGFLCFVTLLLDMVINHRHIGHTVTDVKEWRKSAVFHLTSLGSILLFISFFIVFLSGLIVVRKRQPL